MSGAFLHRLNQAGVLVCLTFRNGVSRLLMFE